MGAYTVTDISRLVYNAEMLKKTVGDFYCVLKCNAYGHGAVRCASALYDIGMRHFAVFSVREAMTLRPYVGDSEILILGRTDRDGLSVVSENGFTQTVFSKEYAREIKASGEKIKIHIKVDTGMNRTGFFPDSERIFSSFGEIKDNVCGIYTHFPNADAEDISDTERRLLTFLKISAEVEGMLHRGILKHSAASAAAVRLPRARLDLSRIGLLLYGVSPKSCEDIGVKPVMSFFSRVCSLRKVKKGDTVGYGGEHICQRDSYIATVDGGYADGVRRDLKGRFLPEIMGKRVSFAGNICMDRCMLDVTELVEGGKDIRNGEPVTFFGDGLSVENMAEAAGSISYELLTSVGNLCKEKIYL